jgi:predicted nucleotidyltransferase
MAIENLLRLLKEHKVKFVVIGAAAFPVHGYTRMTLDVDLFIEPSKVNATRCLAALKAFGYDVTDVSVDDLLKKKVLIRQYTVEVDIHPFVKGAKFQDVWHNRVKAKFGKVVTPFASLNDLIKMKKAAGRAKDKEDLKILLALKKKRT